MTPPHVLAMGRESADAVLKEIDDIGDVGSYTFVSCTGYAGLTPDMLLSREFGLRQTLRRTFVGSSFQRAPVPTVAYVGSFRGGSGKAV